MVCCSDDASIAPPRTKYGTRPCKSCLDGKAIDRGKRVTFKLQELLSASIFFPLKPIRRREVMKSHQDLLSPKLLPVPTKLNSLMAIAVFRKDTNVEPPASTNSFLTSVMMNVLTADFDLYED